MPKLRICSVGIEKIIPKDEHLAVFIRLLTRSATGMPITQYTSHFRAPREGGEMHVVLVDNGRSDRLGMERFWPSLKCIRCGACMNTCPVYRRSGGLSYGSTYMGPIGIIMMPTFDIRRYSELPFASTLNGSCFVSSFHSIGLWGIVLSLVLLIVAEMKKKLSEDLTLR